VANCGHKLNAMSGPFNYASLWQQEELSDVEIQLTVGGQAAHPAFPAHSAILSCSPFLKAQVGLVSISMWPLPFIQLCAVYGDWWCCPAPHVSNTA